ncbi:unnamed protein product [Urochloa humidicola]
MLNPNQVAKLKSAGFGDYLNLKVSNPLMEIGLWMLMHLDVKDVCFRFGSGECIPLNRRSLSRLTGLPFKGKQVVEMYNEQSTVYFKTSLGIPLNRRIWDRNLRERILDGRDDDLFVTCWTSLLVAKIFTPSTCLCLRPGLLDVCLDVNNVMSDDWVSYIFEDIRNSAKRAQEHAVGHGSFWITGSTYFLGLYLLDWLEHTDITPPIGEPRFTLWHDNDLKAVEGASRVGRRSFSYLRSLKVRTPENTCYAKDFRYALDETNGLHEAIIE